MADDELLAQFERRSAAATAEISTPEGEEYEAFHVFDRKQLALHINVVGEPIPSGNYSYWLYSIISPSGRRLDVAFTFMTVTLKGRNLFPVRDAIANARTPFVQQYDPKRWPKPKDASAPFIEAISYEMSKAQEPEEDEAG